MNTIKILLVDDDEDDFILTKDILKEHINSQNYELTWCNNFSEAINAMLKSHYDIYLVDYRLGKDSGIDLLNEAIKSNCTEPIIILTGKGDYKIDQEAMQLGAADYLVKDALTGQTLERAIRYSIAHNKTLQRLKTSESKFRIIFERSKDPMLITTPPGQIVDANPAALSFFETTHSDLLKLNAATLYKNKEDRLTYIKTINAEGSITDLEIEMLASSGKAKFCSISSFLQVSQHANEELYYSIIHDLTFRLIQEKEATLTHKLAATERIAKNLSKEIQNPLSNINLAIDELSDALSSEENLALADIIKGNCERINILTTELIESTDVSSLNLVEIDLSAFLDDLLHDARQELDLAIDAPAIENSLIIRAEAENLKAALTDILKNACEAIDKDSGTVKFLIDKRATGLRIDITDNGAGIPPENIDKIFEPFFTTKAKCSGLGLTRAQRIIKGHNGTIRAISEPGKGTTISVFLPV
ncbi:MAG: response regulator [Sphingobacteriaceae bacterium]|nr:response regulator [Sphingobacteriaceae bacterium]